MGKGWRIGRVLGVELRIDSSWVLIAVLVVYSFYLRLTLEFRQLEVGPGIALAFGAGLLFFGSVLIHEMAHAVMARRRGIEVHGITLFLFGGATHARVESRGPRDEFIVSAVGPGTSLVLAGALGGLGVAGRAVLPESVSGALVFLGWLNLLLAIFNLLPGFPLDGGRLLRSAIWGRTGSLTRATRIASIAGQGLGYLLVAGGLLLTLSRRVGGGLWFAAIGWFLAQAARASFEDVRTRHLLQQVEAEAVMRPEEDASGEAVTADGHMTVEPDTPMTEVMTALREGGFSRVLVVHEDRVVGVITREHLEGWLQRRRAVGA